MIAHALNIARDADVDRIVINTHAHAAQMHAWLEAHAPECLISHEPELLETGGGLKKALPLLDTQVAYTLNADMVWNGENPMRMLAEAWDARRMDALLCLVPRSKAVGHTGRGDFHLDPFDRVSRRGETALAPFVYSGCQILKLDLLRELPPRSFSLNTVWDQMLARGRVSGAVFDGAWIDVGRPEGIALAEAEAVR